MQPDKLTNGSKCGEMVTWYKLLLVQQLCVQNERDGYGFVRSNQSHKFGTDFNCRSWRWKLSLLLLVTEWTEPSNENAEWLQRGRS
jgi:hypothetical protein